MTDFDDLLKVVLELRHELAELKHVVANSAKTGVVEESDAEKGYRVKWGEDADGNSVLSPWYPHPESGGALKTWLPITKGEIVHAINPGGDSRQGWIERGGFSDNNKPPSKKLDENVIEFGPFRMELREGDLHVKGGSKASGSTLTMTPDGKVTLTGKADPKGPHELNEQLKGLAARVSQNEHNLHGLFDVTSRMREIAQGRIPELLALAPILNKQPAGLEKLASEIEGKAKSYLETAFKQALGKFQVPNIGDVGSLVAGGLQGTIASLQAQISASAANPVVATVDGLREQIEDLATGGAVTDLIASEIAGLQAQVSALEVANPIVGAVAGLRAQLAGWLEQAAPALNFLDPQKTLTQGVTRSLRLGGAG